MNEEWVAAYDNMLPYATEQALMDMQREEKPNNELMDCCGEEVSPQSHWHKTFAVFLAPRSFLLAVDHKKLVRSVA